MLIFHRVVNSTLAIGLSTSWTSTSVTILDSARDSQMRTSRKPLLWYNTEAKEVRRWSGWTYGGNPNDREESVWTFSPDGQGNAEWTQNLPPTISGSSLVNSFGASTAHTPAAFYSLGGTLVPPMSAIGDTDNTPNIPIPGLLFSNFLDNDVWTNASSVGIGQSGFSVLGEASFAPNFGQDGLIVFLGGDSPSDGTYQYQEGTALLDMATIPLYDVHSRAWFHQVASGDVPPGRSGLCVVGAPTADNSSFEMCVIVSRRACAESDEAI